MKSQYTNNDDTNNDDIKILIVDDEYMNRVCTEINLYKYIGCKNYASVCDGLTCLEYLANHSDVSVILMDEIMKHTHGVPTLLKMNENPQYKDIIVVFQTGMTEIEDKKKFLEAGSLYLLQKPFSYKVQKVIIDSILPIVRAKRRIKEKINTGRIYNKEEFILSTLDEAEDVAASLAINFPEPYKVYEAIYELVKNGIEHGNLGIGYNTKTHILEEGSYVDEITSRAVSSENKNKMIKTYLTKDDSYLTLYIEDQGQGFNFDDFPKFDIEGLKKPCGRGIYKASQVFDNIKYLNNGSMVVCQHKLH